MHVEFLYPCEAAESIITIDVLRVGELSSTLQVKLSHEDKLKACPSLP